MYRSVSSNREPLSRVESSNGRRGGVDEFPAGGRTLSRNESMASIAGYVSIICILQGLLLRGRCAVICL